jgi:hypothetical protein
MLLAVLVQKRKDLGNDKAPTLVNFSYHFGVKT